MPIAIVFGLSFEWRVLAGYCFSLAYVIIATMRAYELVTIISPEVDGDGLSDAVDKVVKFITDKGGVVDEVSQWGKRKLAYPVQKFMEGNYVLTRFQLKPQLIRGLDTSLEGSGEILRHLVVRVED